MEKFARKCDKTGKGMNQGFCVGDGEFYFSEEKFLIEWLRTQDFVTAEGKKANSFSDEDLKEWAYNDEVYYWTEWNVEDDEDDTHYDEAGNLYDENGVLFIENIVESIKK